MNARRLLHSAVSVGVLLALSACEQPTPLVTVVSGGTSVYSEASTWCFEDQTGDDCTERDQPTVRLAVRGGETVGVDVGKELVDDGWFIELSDPQAQDAEAQQPQRSEPQTGHYFTFDAPNLPAGSRLLLTVRSLTEDAEPSGEWRFTLTPKR